MAGKRDLIPIYAAHLQRPRAIQVLARIFQDIVDSDEQDRMLKLLQQYKFDIPEILKEHLEWVLGTAFAREPDMNYLRILERTVETKLHPRQRIIVGFLSDELTDSDESLIRALRWFQLLQGHWATTFEALTNALMRCFGKSTMTSHSHATFHPG